jgi:hypothetical protein
LFDGNNHILRAEILECADDAGARQWAERFAADAAGAYVELWERDRLIGRVARAAARAGQDAVAHKSVV